MSYQNGVRVDLSHAEAIARTRALLTDQGFGVLSEIDLQRTLREKRGVEMEPYVILGACNPDLASRALEVDRSIGALLPCTVVVRAMGEGRSLVQILDPRVMSSLSGEPDLEPVVEEASRRLDLVLRALAEG